ncbi:hypothetical protein EDB84DRAFT_1571857 [Lactarius hengduanensis]|nr:hypothetical protein EDB84DRAFT_1571857 [Lactarius hengduanensis]
MSSPLRLHVLLDLQPHMVGRKKAMRDFLWGRVSLPPQLLIHDDILGIRLRLWLNLWPLAFLSNTTPGSTLRPLLTTLSFTLIHHGKKQSTRHYLPLNLVILIKKTEPTPQNPKRSGTSASASSQSQQRRYSPSPRGPRHEDAMMASKPTLSSLTEMEEQSRRDYIRELREVADEADVVLMLDVHDLTGAAPTGREEMRSCETEEMRLVFVFI